MAPVDPAEPDRLARFVRPYTLTAGRTQATVHLPLEATLRRLPLDVRYDLTTGARQVLETCDHRSVAEVASFTSMPIGVVRVLLSDLAGCVHRSWGALDVTAAGSRLLDR